MLFKGAEEGQWMRKYFLAFPSIMLILVDIVFSQPKVVAAPYPSHPPIVPAPTYPHRPGDSADPHGPPDAESSHKDNFPKSAAPVINDTFIGYDFNAPVITSAHAEWNVALRAYSLPHKDEPGIVFALLPESIDNKTEPPLIEVGVSLTENAQHQQKYQVFCHWSADKNPPSSCGIQDFYVHPGDSISTDFAQIDAGQWSITLHDLSGFSHSSRIVYFPNVITRALAGEKISGKINNLMRARFGLVEINGRSMGELQAKSWVINRDGKEYYPGPIGPSGFDILSKAV